MGCGVTWVLRVCSRDGKKGDNDLEIERLVGEIGDNELGIERRFGETGEKDQGMKL